MQRSWKLQILSILLSVTLVACSDSIVSESDDDSGVCQSYPFPLKSGVQLNLPLAPLSILIDSDGINFKLESTYSIDFFVFELEPYITFDVPGKPLSPCLKVQIENPEWESGYRRFYVNFNNDNVFRVRVRTDDYTEFVFSKERWIANPPGEQPFVRYDYHTNTLFLDASNGRIEEFEILAENREAREKYIFCVSELENKRKGYFTHPVKYLFAYFQDLVNSTREIIFGKFGPSSGGIVIAEFWLIGAFFSLLPLRKKRETVSGNWIIGRFAFLVTWTFFWGVVFFAIPVCWG